jgi:hypothetical protein
VQPQSGCTRNTARIRPKKGRASVFPERASQSSMYTGGIPRSSTASPSPAARRMTASTRVASMLLFAPLL